MKQILRPSARHFTLEAPLVLLMLVTISSMASASGPDATRSFRDTEFLPTSLEIGDDDDDDMHVLSCFRRGDDDDDGVNVQPSHPWGDDDDDGANLVPRAIMKLLSDQLLRGWCHR